MKLGIMQPYFFPYVGYWQLLNAVDLYILYDDVNYIKGGWINRNRILINNVDKYFTLSCHGASSNKNINEIEVGKNKNKLIKTIEYNYKKAPYFESIFPIIENIITFEEDNLAIYLENSIIRIANLLGIKTRIIKSSEINNDEELKGENRVINLCKKNNADVYINPIGGEFLYSKETFQLNNIDLKFLKTNQISYEQFSSPFISHLSIIDLLMFNGIEKCRLFLKEYTLI